jgi:hypothetical protein
MLNSTKERSLDLYIPSEIPSLLEDVTGNIWLVTKKNYNDYWLVCVYPNKQNSTKIGEMIHYEVSMPAHFSTFKGKVVIENG